MGTLYYNFFRKIELIREMKFDLFYNKYVGKFGLGFALGHPIKPLVWTFAELV